MVTVCPCPSARKWEAMRWLLLKVSTVVGGERTSTSSCTRCGYVDFERLFVFTLSASFFVVRIVRKRLGLEISLYQILQILSVMLFEKTPILQALQPPDSQNDLLASANQLILFDL